MASSQRTYGRKRKDPASEKFEALFSNQNGKKQLVVQVAEVKRRKCHTVTVSPTKKLDSPTKPSKASNGISNESFSSTFSKQSPSKYVTRTRETAAEKFDAIFGDNSAKEPVVTITSVKPKVFSLTDTDDEDEKSVEITRDSLKNSGTVANDVQSKYDKLFQKNEKSASDKFDALFGDEVEANISQNSTKQISPLKSHIRSSEKTTYNDPDFDNLFGFANNNELGVSLNSNPLTSNKEEEQHYLSSKRSVTKPAAGITGATMKTVDGKVVLNIQRSKKIASPVKTAFIEAPCFDDFASNQLKQKENFRLSSCGQQDSAKDDNFDCSVDKALRVAPISIISLKKSDSMPPQRKNPTSSKHKEMAKGKVESLGKPASNTKASYNSRPWLPDNDDFTSSQEVELQAASSQPSSSSQQSIDCATPQLTRSVTWPSKIGDSMVTSIKCKKSARAYYTVVKHVKNYQNCLEEGEAKEFEDDVDYLIEGLQSSQPIPVRCLSLTNLASKCQQHAFRLYLRAHNVSDKVFSRLQDAKDDKALALSVSALLFMLSRDRQMEINKSTLQLLLKIIDPFGKDAPKDNGPNTTDASKENSSNGKYRFFKSRDAESQASDKEKNNEVVLSKIQEMVDSCGDPLLTGKDVSAKRLASEALLRFTARKTSEWFRDEIRLKGGLDHIISQVKIAVDKLEPLIKQIYQANDFVPNQTLCLLERLLKVLENAIANSARNAMYLVTHQHALLLKKIARLMCLCKHWLAQHQWSSEKSEENGGVQQDRKPYTTIHSAILQIIKLLVNISNDNEWISSRVGDQDGLLRSIVACVLSTPRKLQPCHQYEIILLSLSLLVNLVESSAKNRIALMKMSIDGGLNISGEGGNISVIKSLVKLFTERELAARDNEVLGEIGVKKAVQARKGKEGFSSSSADSPCKSQPHLRAHEHDGHWVETEDGMEWVPADQSESDTLMSSQESVRSSVSNRNPENSLTAEEKTEMKQTLDKANEHMEDSIVASYIALVLGCLIHGNRGNSPIIRSHLSENGFGSMIAMLKKFLSFMALTAGMSRKGEKTLTQIIEDMEEEESNFTKKPRS
ncbi:wings apart-like protein homolog isoform X1 [Clavelina lepadiformis]|uniref:wings apart-like protein homolog isoform X1 n=1 Tax=Clavelina lepadiformis TaxID=159417 RepID=UPI00404317A7